MREKLPLILKGIVEAVAEECVSNLVKARSQGLIKIDDVLLNQVVNLINQSAAQSFNRQLTNFERTVTGLDVRPVTKSSESP